MQDIKIEDLQIIIEKPDFIGIDCDKHHFYGGKIGDKLAVIYVEMTSDKKGEVICASWLNTVEECKNKIKQRFY